MLKSFKYRIYPTEEQMILLNKHLGAVRFIYNKSLEKKIEAYKSDDKISLSRFDLQKEIPALKKELSWLKEINSQSLQVSIMNLDNAYKGFFKYKKGFPKFKKKTNDNSFTIPQSITVNDDELFIPKFKTGIKMVIDRKHKGQIRCATISKTTTGKYFVSILCNTCEIIPEKKEFNIETTIGIDLGIKSFLAFSDGRTVDNSNFLKNNLEFLKFLQRKLAKQNKISNRYKVTKQRIALLHEHVKNQRKDFLHKLSTEITNQYDNICIEDLNVKGMLRNHKLARAIQDVSWSEFTNMLKYKSEWKGNNLIIVPRFYPSSKTCHVCGYIKHDLKLTDRNWLCPDCKTYHDRDENAAINIKYYPVEHRILGVEASSMDDRLLRPKKYLVNETSKISPYKADTPLLAVG